MRRKPTIPADPRVRQARRRFAPWLAMVCLVALWAHVWQHDAGHAEDGHYGTAIGEQCLLADTPPVTMVTGPACPAPSAQSSRLVAPPNAVADSRRPNSHRIRAPPLTV